MSANLSFQGGIEGGCSWKDLDQLRLYATQHGCTAAQFAYAIERAGTEPSKVAAYLENHSFIKRPVLRSVPPQQPSQNT